jgi:hypothetical protein
MPEGIKRTLLWLLFAFFLYAIITNPDRAADIVQAIWNLIADGFRNIGRFFEALVGS